jgi:hypothetical protein
MRSSYNLRHAIQTKKTKYHKEYTEKFQGKVIYCNSPFFFLLCYQNPSQNYILTNLGFLPKSLRELEVCGCDECIYEPVDGCGIEELEVLDLYYSKVLELPPLKELRELSFSVNQEFQVFLCSLPEFKGGLSIQS